MTRLILEIPTQSDLDMLLPLLKRLQIRFANVEIPTPLPNEIEEAIRVVLLGCNMHSFGDALQYQVETRQERPLPFRD